MFHVIFLGFSTKMIFCFFAKASNGFTQTSKDNDLPVKKKQTKTYPSSKMLFSSILVWRMAMGI